MFLSLLHRKIFFELLKVFGLSLIGIMSILVMAGIITEATQRGLKPAQVFIVIPLLVPSFFPYTIPATTLFATCVVYGRLARDNEILAIKAAGINILNVVWPGLLLGTMMSAVTMGLYYRVIPYTQYLLRARVLNDVEEFMYDMLRMEHCFRRPNVPYMIWVRQVDGTRLQDPLFKRFDLKRPYKPPDLVVTAREAELHVDLPRRTVCVVMRDGEAIKETGDHLCFESRTWEVPIPPDFSDEVKPKPRFLSWARIPTHVRRMSEELHTLDGHVQEHAGRHSRGEAAPELQDYKNKVNAKRREIYDLETEYHIRPALSVGCFCFVMIGCPVGIWFNRGDYLSAFITCFVPIVFLYYPILLCCTNEAKLGHCLLIVWAADAVVAIVGLVLFRELLKH